MRKNIFTSVLTLSLGAIVSVSCSSKLGNLTADNFKVTPTPLELQGTQVPVTVYGTFPEKFMKKKAVVTVSPELRYANGKVLRGQSSTFQGEKVLGNGQTVNYKLGGQFTMRDAFNYTDEMHKSDLYLNFNAKVGKKTVQVPAVKVGYGIVATAGLYKKALEQGGGIIAPDSFQYIVKKKQEAGIKFLINQAQLRKSELKNNSVKEFIKLLKNISADAEKYNFSDVEVLAYASPDGGEKFNTELANKRQRESQKYVEEQLKKSKLTNNVTGEYTAQDWEGFQELVSASNIQDKELILNVLSMYKDPQEREEQIRNLSLGFQELAQEILPQLRRARMIINYEIVGRSDEKIAALYASTPDSLSADEILYHATHCKSIDQKEEAYKKCAQLYPNDYRAYNNVAAMEFAKGNLDATRSWVKRALAVNPNAGEAQSNLALAALKQGKLQEAEGYMAKAGNSNDLNRVQGAVNFVKGNYKKAAVDYKDVNNNMAALAQIMAKDYSAARATFNQIGENGDALTNYLHAVLSAREGNKFAAKSNLDDAIEKDPSLKQYAEDDLEFANIK
ncbi:MAG: hypothetical protein ACI4CB_00080 [Prevotella sp.]|nr:hypothetical protein [Prevotella sp.]MDD7128503.1 hypothetical protein [Prevotella sp.]MDD7508507.1 hypothetical protein [Prevotella sp.]